MLNGNIAIMKKNKRKKKASGGHDNSNQGPFFPSIQTKLAIGKADDVYEKEADTVADKVVNTSTEGTSIQKKGGEEEQLQEKPLSQSISTLQKQEMPAEEEPVQKAEAKEEEPVQKMEEEEAVQQKGEEEEAQTKPEEEEAQTKPEEEEEKVQKKGNGKSANPRIESTIKSTKGQGQKMDPSTQRTMEKGFGADFSDINIHTDSKAQETSHELGAQAFTTGNDIYFNEGKYNPNSKEGKHLLAHELTHTIQQTGTIEKKIQKNPETATSLISRMKELKKIALNDASNFTDELRVEFINGLNQIFSGMTVNHFNHANVEAYPEGGKLNAKSIYFSANPSVHKYNPGVTKSGATMFGSFMPGIVPSGQQAEAIIILGLNCIMDTISYTQSILEHEAIHVNQTYTNTGSNKESNDEIVAYSEQFSRIYSFSEAEIYSQLTLWLKYFVYADKSFQDNALERTIYHLLYRYDQMLAPTILEKIADVKKWITNNLKGDKVAKAQEALSYIEYTLQNKNP